MNFESPIEEEMARILEKFLNPEISFESQTEVQTICGLFRMDFVLSDGKFRVGLECDGREFHKERHHLDEWRDAAILGDGFVDEIVRIPGKAIFYNPNACAYFLSKWYPRFFTERSLQVLKSMIRKELEDGDLIDLDEMDAVVYFNDGDGNRIT
ncbi:MAG: hypothetical protein LIP18_05415, partial [Planctomycetes bacterium]|nr:hypothetical protein [Planctomycetota bacterium]